MIKMDVLYQLKSLEKMIFRLIIKDNDKKNFELIPTPTQMEILEYVLEHNSENIYQKDLENVLNLRRATVSGVLQTMEKNNLIERITDSIDTRTKRIILTEKSKEVFAERKEKLEDIEKVITRNISKEELEVFFKVTETMKTNIKNGT